MLIDTIRADRLVAMKERDELKRDLLGTLFAAATKDSKTPDDATVVRSIRAFVKSLDETIAALKERDSSRQQREKAILEAYLPRTIPPETLQASIAEIVAGLPERSPKAMGQVMAELKARHGEAVDMKQASGLVKAALG
ncbi:MAG TPA: GatB/YqeY domain-containing protein [Geminicoccaceae bacterium]|nr:GatB/YqeY domain-containing protein [Geminicoccus sp.]HMU49971.1 GatB/YqeY domain-containing protein [Geminicoccaceae bacterium]